MQQQRRIDSVVAGFGGLGVQSVKIRLPLQHTVVVTSDTSVMARSMGAIRSLAILCLVVSLGSFNYYVYQILLNLVAWEYGWLRLCWL